MTIDIGEKPITIDVEAGTLPGELSIPENALGVVIFAHGSGSSRLSPRNRFVAQVLHSYKVGTLLFDLLTEEEDQDYERRFDISLLTDRLVQATQWFMKHFHTYSDSIGYFGASTGSASALRAEVEMRGAIKAVVSRGGRPDLALGVLPVVKAPTLLIVGGNDLPVIDMNRTAYEKLNTEKRLAIVPGATHLFEEPGALQIVADLAVDWFRLYLKSP